MAKPVATNTSAARPRLLAVELWGVGDVALALPFLRAASAHADVTLLAKAHAAPLLHRLAPAVQLISLHAPWTAFRGKYQLHRWPWAVLRRRVRDLRAGAFDFAVSARPDPRDHVLLRLSGARQRLGFPRAGSGPLLSTALARPDRLHRSAYWSALADHLGWTLPSPSLASPPPTTVAVAPSPTTPTAVFHLGAGHPVRQWPRDRYAEIAVRLRRAGWNVTLLDDGLEGLNTLMNELARATLFIGNDSGPGHLAAALGVPTFTIFGPQLPEAFLPSHPHAAWIEGVPCPHKPCFDSCRFARAHCLLDLTVDAVWTALQPALRRAAA